MSVPAIELRPRGALQLFDAAIRLCARSSDLWAISIIPAALVVGAVLKFVDAIDHVRPLFLPTLLLTGAWLIRAIGQGASCWYLEKRLLSNEEVTPLKAYRAALGRLPSLWITAGYNLVFNAITLPLTVGLAVLFLSAHTVGYAVTMQGKGHPLALYGTCARLLGKARGNANMVRVLYGAQFLVMLNLHIAVIAVLAGAQKLMGLDVSFAMRFASLDNAPYVATFITVGYVLFDPLRAATASLLLIDGRVRQEGLDLLAIIDQLPRRRRSSAAPSAAALILLAILLPARAFAEGGTPEELRARIWAAGTGCGMKGELFREQISAVEEVAKTEPEWIRELAEEVDALSEEDDCARVVEKLQDGLALALERRDALRMKALDSLQDPEGKPADQKVLAPEEDVEGSALRARFWAVGNECGVRGEQFRRQLDAVELLAPKAHGALSRSLRRVEALAYDDEDCEAAAAALRHDLQWVEQTANAAKDPNAPNAAQRAREILSRSEFAADGVVAKDDAQPAPEDKVPDDSPSWWDRFLKWLKELLESRREKQSSFQSPTASVGGDLFANVIVVAAVALVIAVVGYLLITMRNKNRKSGEQPEVATASLVDPSQDPNSALSKTPQGWASMADRFAREGRFREAVRSLYLALLARLHTEGAIDYDPAKSNWEYFRGFKGPSAWLHPFRELTRRFDYAWYGNDAVTHDGYREFRALTEPMLAGSEAARA